MADEALEEGEIAGELNSLAECAAEQVIDLTLIACHTSHAYITTWKFVPL